MTNSALESVMGKDIAEVRKEMKKRADYVRKVASPKNAGNTEYKKLGDYTLIRMFYPMPADFLEIQGEQFALGSEHDSYEFELCESYRTDFEQYVNAMREACRRDGITFVPVIYHEVNKKRYSFPCSLRGIVSMNVARKEYRLYFECMQAIRKAGTAETDFGSLTAPEGAAARADGTTPADSCAASAAAREARTTPADSCAASAAARADGTTPADPCAASAAASAPGTSRTAGDKGSVPSARGADEDVSKETLLFLCEAEHEEREDLIQRPMIEGERGALDEMDSLMKFQTFAITPFLAAAFFVAGVFSWQFQATGESGIGQTIFLFGMGIGFLVFAIYNTVIRVRKMKRHNDAVRQINERRKAAYEAALAAEKERYLEEKEKLMRES